MSTRLLASWLAAFGILCGIGIGCGSDDESPAVIPPVVDGGSETGDGDASGGSGGTGGSGATGGTGGSAATGGSGGSSGQGGVAGALPPLVFPGADWETDTPEGQGVDSDKLQEALDYVESFSGDNGIREVVVIRNGYMIWSGDNIDRKHQIWSATKVLTSTALGLLIDDGLATLDTHAVDYHSLLSADYSGIQLRHLASMTSGYDAVGGTYGTNDTDGSETPWDPTTPCFEPGTMFHYHDDAMGLFGLVLTKIGDKPLQDLLEERILDPIGLTGWTWPDFGQYDGYLINTGQGEFETTARQFARLGLLFLARGSWDGQQLISASWVRQASSLHVPATLPAYSGPIYRDIEGVGSYGFNWWVNAAGGMRHMSDAPDGVYWASGYNHNKMFVIPEWNMVIVRLGTDGTTTDWNGAFRILSEGIIGP